MSCGINLTNVASSDDHSSILLSRALAPFASWHFKQSQIICGGLSVGLRNGKKSTSLKKVP